MEPKRLKQLHELENFLSPQGNYKLYRAALEELEPTALRIPILHLFIKDLLFTSDGNPKYLETEVPVSEPLLKLINFQKLKLIYEKVIEFCKLHTCKYTIPQVSEEAKEMTSTMRCLKEQQLYKYSCLCEPKVGDTENLRGKWMAQ